MKQSTVVTVVEGTTQPFAGASAQAGGAGFNAGGESSDLPIPNSNLWGGAAAALLGVALAEWQRRREAAAMRNGGGEEDEIPADVLARRRAKVIAKNEAKRAQERLWEAARIAALEAKSACPKADELPPTSKPAFDLACWKERDYAETARWEQQQKKQQELRDGLIAYYLGRKAGEAAAQLAIAT